MTKEKIWVERYRPTTLSEYLSHDQSHEQSFKQMVAQKTIPHLLLSGVTGSGKTTLAKILIHDLDVNPADVLTLNASKENSVDTMREKISGFISTLPFGDFKVVLLDEADYITLNGQAVLRNMMEENADTARFILTCNYENKIIPPLKSRCQQFRFKAHDRDAVIELVAKILIKEKVKFDLELLEKYVSVGYPDIRKIINLLQQNCINGELKSQDTQKDAADYKFELLDLITQDDWSGARTVVCGNVAAEDWEDLYRFLYENINKSTKFAKIDKWEQAIITIADHLHKHSIVADPEINAAAMFIRLGQI